MLSEAFCKYEDREIFKPYEEHHSTCKEAAELAQKLEVKNLILYHTEDKTIDTRKAAYTAEAKQYFDGNVFVPDDLEIIEF
jgi:ribonuclease Z